MDKQQHPKKIKSIYNDKGELTGLEVVEWLTITEIKKYYPDYYKECKKKGRWITK